MEGWMGVTRIREILKDLQNFPAGPIHISVALSRNDVLSRCSPKLRPQKERSLEGIFPQKVHFFYTAILGHIMNTILQM